MSLNDPIFMCYEQIKINKCWAWHKIPSRLRYNSAVEWHHMMVLNGSHSPTILKIPNDEIFYPSFLVCLDLHVAAQIKFRQPMPFNPVKGLLSQDQFNMCMHKTRHRIKQVHGRKVKVRESHKTSSFQLFIGAQVSSVSQLHIELHLQLHLISKPSNMKTLTLSRETLHISNIYKAYSRYFFCIEFIF